MNTTTEEDISIYQLVLHESLHYDNEKLIITRVPNGWLYKFYIMHGTIMQFNHIVFVPQIV